LPCIDYFIFDVYMVCDFDWFGALYDNQLLQCNVQPLFCFFSQLRIGYQEWGKSLEASVQKRLTGTGLLDARAKARCTRITKGGFSPLLSCCSPSARKITPLHFDHQGGLME
jgi:hypothetical protein